MGSELLSESSLTSEEKDAFSISKLKLNEGNTVVEKAEGNHPVSSSNEAKKSTRSYKGHLVGLIPGAYEKVFFNGND